MVIELLPIMVIGQGLMLVLFTAMWIRGRLRLRAASQQWLKLTKEAEESAVRRLRLASQDLRSIGMTLHGNADDLGNAGIANAAGIATAAADVFDMADDLHEFTLQESAARVLRDEEIHLAVAVEDAVATVNAAIGPGRRQWRITPEVAATLLSADRRGLRHIFTRALTSVVRNTRHDGWIEIGVQTRADGLAVAIENERFGAAAPEANPAINYDSRGFSLRLTLARSLMEMHGGQLEVELRPNQGMRVCLIFPAGRVRHSPVPHVAAAPMQLETAA